MNDLWSERDAINQVSQEKHERVSSRTLHFSLGRVWFECIQNEAGISTASS